MYGDRVKRATHGGMPSISFSHLATRKARLAWTPSLMIFRLFHTER